MEPPHVNPEANAVNAENIESGHGEIFRSLWMARQLAGAATPRR
jgi:hypothetical protein